MADAIKRPKIKYGLQIGRICYVPLQEAIRPLFGMDDRPWHWILNTCGPQATDFESGMSKDSSCLFQQVDGLRRAAAPRGGIR